MEKLLISKTINHQLYYFFFQESFFGAVMCLSVHLPTYYPSTLFFIESKQCKANKQNKKNPLSFVIWKENAPASGKLTWNSMTFAFYQLYTSSTYLRGGFHTINIFIHDYIQKG